MNLWNLPNNTIHSIPQTLFPIIQAEVTRQCDGADGVLDGIIGAPDRCDFHPETLLCTPSTNQSACLTSPQIETLYRIYGNWIETNQTFVFPNMKYGSEWQWSLVHDGGGDDQFSPAYIRNIVYNNTTWSIWNFSYDTVLDAERVNRAQGLDADNFDLSPFSARGGKLLHYVGLSDGFIPAGSSEYYYNHVLRTLAPRNISISSFYRLFEIPGMGHCAGSGVAAPWYINGAGQAGSIGTSVRGVPGFDNAQHDAVLALMKWVEEKVAPTTLIATKFTNDTDYTQGVNSQRPLCPYPQIAAFRGGDVTQADSWECANATDYAARQ
jgi:feruloyl esterase